MKRTNRWENEGYVCEVHERLLRKQDKNFKRSRDEEERDEEKLQESNIACVTKEDEIYTTYKDEDEEGSRNHDKKKNKNEEPEITWKATSSFKRERERDVLNESLRLWWWYTPSLVDEETS